MCDDAPAYCMICNRPLNIGPVCDDYNYPDDEEDEE